jgi:hypothetical protein
MNRCHVSPCSFRFVEEIFTEVFNSHTHTTYTYWHVHIHTNLEAITVKTSLIVSMETCSVCKTCYPATALVYLLISWSLHSNSMLQYVHLADKRGILCCKLPKGGFINRAPEMYSRTCQG